MLWNTSELKFEFTTTHEYKYIPYKLNIILPDSRNTVVYDNIRSPVLTLTQKVWTSEVLTLRLLMSYIYGAPILEVSRSHITTQHSR